jgi:RNA polymerase sigma-70 factor (ECF subfamily)
MVGRGADALVAAARTGDERAWAQLYASIAGRLEAWLRWLPDLDAASSPEDIASQAWLTAASKIHEFRGSDDDFAGWLFGIARRHALNQYRKDVRRRTAPTDVQQDADTLVDTAVDDVAGVDAQDRMRQLLAGLSPREAEVIACVDVIGLDVRGAAEALDMNPTAVRVARHRGLNRLRKLMAAEGELLADPEPGPAST